MPDAAIASIVGREALDSRGNPTVEAEVTLTDGSVGLALVPSGASTGSYEALELRDGDVSRFGGNGTITAVANVNDRIAPMLQGTSPFVQRDVDAALRELDGTNDKSGLGANAVLAVSMAAARAASVSAGNSLWRHLSDGRPVSLPVPLLNILNGGRHASNSADVQEFMVAPAGFERFSDALRAGVEIYQSLKSILRNGGHNLNVGDEGGFAPTLPSNRDAIEVVLQAIASAGYEPGRQVYIALDVAASELWNAETGEYDLAREGTSLSAEQLVALYAGWCDEYPIISIEDGLFEDDWDGWTTLTQQLGSRIQLVGDDLLVTNISRLRRGIDTAAANAILLKPNQIGTISETEDALAMARDAGWTAVMSHRSGETEDTTIADLAVAWDVGQIKTGAPARSERVAKYNRLLRIEAELGPGARYAGESIYRHLTSQQLR
jgi:enolase